MEETGRAPELDDHRSPIKLKFLGFWMAIALSGAMPFLSYFFRGFTWIVWGMVLLVMVSCALEMSLRRHLMPLMPYLVWLSCYLIWGTIVSPIPDPPFAARTLASTFLLGTAMAIFSARPRYLRTLANAAQFAVMINLLLLIVLPMSSGLQEVVLFVTKRPGLLDAGMGRYGGLWGNPNMAGFVCLLAIALSVLASPGIGWLGRLSCAPIIYYGASRRGGVFFLVAILLYALMVQRRNLRFWIGSLAVAIALFTFFNLSRGLQVTARSASQDVAVNRMLDLEEENTTRRGGESRIDLLHHYVSLLDQTPWYGLGLKAMTGNQYDENDPSKVVGKGLMPLGSHNTYLGLWIDVGPVGAITFALLMLSYIRLCLIFRGPPALRWVVVFLGMVNATYLFFSHDLLFTFEGQISYTLLFLLPQCSAMLMLTRSPKVLAS